MIYYTLKKWRDRPFVKRSALLQGEEIKAAQAAFSLPDPRELNPLQLAYVGDTLHDLYVRSMLVAKKMSVGAMHRQAVKMVSAAAQAAAS